MKKTTKNSILLISLLYLFSMTGCSPKAVTPSSTGADIKNNAVAAQAPIENADKAPAAEIKTDTSKTPEATQNTENKTATAKPSSTQTAGIKDLKYNTESLPILTYHSVGNTNGNELIIAPELLDKEMKWLKDNGYTTLTLDEAYNFFINNKPVPKKSVVLTFDDGYVDNYTTMYPILKKYGFKATIFVITDTVDKNSAYLTSAQLKELDANGMDIQSHTVLHEKLGTLTYEKQVETLKNSKQFLDNLLNKKASYLAYPEGSYNDLTPKAAKEAGYTMAVTMDGRWSNKSNGIYKLYRVYISAFFDMNTFIERVTNPQYKRK